VNCCVYVAANRICIVVAAFAALQGLEISDSICYGRLATNFVRLASANIALGFLSSKNSCCCEYHSSANQKLLLA